ncbi:MAG: NifB/NifX family molybdenum-iron cluster-binding protein [Marinifilaceae bacterium]
MKIVFSAKGKDWDAPTDPSFGRAQGFLLFDEEKNELSWHSNEQNVMASQGAGIQAAQNVANLGAEVLVTRYAGPKAYRTLKKSSIQIYSISEEMSVRDAYEKFKAGELVEQEPEAAL